VRFNSRSLVPGGGNLRAAAPAVAPNVGAGFPLIVRDVPQLSAAHSTTAPLLDQVRAAIRGLSLLLGSGPPSVRFLSFVVNPDTRRP